MDFAIIPFPRHLTTTGDPFTITASTRVHVAAGAEPVGEVLATLLRTVTGFSIPVDTAIGAISLTLAGDLDRLGREGYSLDVSNAGVWITAAQAAGLFY